MGDGASDDGLGGRCGGDVVDDVTVVAVQKGRGAGEPLGCVLGGCGIGVGGGGGVEV